MKAQIDADLGPKPDGSVRFPRRDVIALPVIYTDDERHAHADLAAYAALRRNRTRERPSDDAASEACDLMPLLLKKRLFSSPAAFATTLDAHLRTLAAPRTTHRPARTHPRRYDETDDDYALDDEFEEATEEALLVAGAPGRLHLSVATNHVGCFSSLPYGLLAEPALGMVRPLRMGRHRCGTRYGGLRE